ICYLAAISNRFIELWIGNGMKMVAFPLSVLVVVSFVNLATGPGFLIFAGRGYLKPGVESAVLGITLNIVLSLGLIYRFGFAGAVIGTSISLLAASTYFVFIFHRRTKYSFTRLLKESYIKPILISVSGIWGIMTVRPVNNLSWFGLAAM